MKRRQAAEGNSEELFRYARSYLSTAFPNPNRDGCPPDAALGNLASDPRTADPGLGEHISYCSPCFTRYMEILAAQRGEASSRSRSWTLRPLAWVTGVLVVIVAIAIYIGVRSITGIREPGKPAFSRLVMNLEPFSGSRGPIEGQKPANPALIVPRRPTDLLIQLPVGSEEGIYKVSLNSANKSLWSASSPAKLLDHKLSLEVWADFRQVPAGQYSLQVESDAGMQISAPVLLQDPSTTRSKSTRSAVLGTLLESVLLARDWFSGSYRHTAHTQSADPKQLLAEADHYAWLGNWAIAAPLYSRAETLFKERGDAPDEIHARVGHIRGTAETMPFAKVSSMLEEQLENPIVQNDPHLKLWCLAQKGYTDLDVDPPSARRVWEQVRVIAKSLGERAWEGRASGELGIISFLEGDGATAKKLVGGAFFTAVRTGDVGAQIRYFSMFGNGLNELNRYDEALEYFNRALVLADHTPDIGFPFMAYEGKAQALVALNKSDDAKSLLNHALTEAKKLDRRGHESQLYIVLGKLALAKGDEEAAIKYLDEARELARSAQFYRMDADSMFALAGIYRAENKLDHAEECLQEGITASRKIGDRFYLPRDLAALAEIKTLQGDTRTADLLYDQASDVLDGLLINAASPNAKSSIVAAMSEIYVRHFAVAARMRNTSEAFAIVERARGRSAADLLRASTLRTATPNETPADRQITNLQLQLLHSVSISERKQILSDLFDTEQRRAVEMGTATAASVARRPINIRDLQRVLHPDEMLLEYVVSDAGSYCLAVSRSCSVLTQLSKGHEFFEGSVHSYLRAVRRKDDTEDMERQLYGALVGSVPGIQHKLRLVIVPDGSLNLLPFDTLRDSDGKYLLHSHIVSYAPSSTVLYVLRTELRHNTPSLPFLGVGDVTYSSAHQLTAKNTAVNQPPEVVRGIYDLAGAQFPELPGTRQEIMTAGQVFGRRSVLLIGSAASEAAFKAEPLSKFRVIHLAVHGVAAPKYPERAALVLGNDPQNREDGLLQAREITALRLNADLVTLSACDTGIGKLEGEEGIQSLERAFLIAGAKTVLATLWSADDTFTVALVKAFYTHLANHEDKGAALRNAKLDVIHKFGEQAPPYYWAGFTLDGDSAAPISSSIQ